MPEHLFITQTKETELCLSQDFGSLRGVFSIKTRHYHSRWLPLHTMQLEIDVDGERCCGLKLLLCCVFAANASETTVVFVTELLLSSVLALVPLSFIKSCASAFSFSQSLKSRKLGFTQSFLTVKSDQDSFILSGSFCTAVLRSAALFKSESYESVLKTLTRLELHGQHQILNDAVANVHLQCWKAAEFVQMGTYDHLWLAKFTF